MNILLVVRDHWARSQESVLAGAGISPRSFVAGEHWDYTLVSVAAGYEDIYHESVTMACPTVDLRLARSPACRGEQQEPLWYSTITTTERTPQEIRPSK